MWFNPIMPNIKNYTNSPFLSWYIFSSNNEEKLLNYHEDSCWVLQDHHWGLQCSYNVLIDIICAIIGVQMHAKMESTNCINFVNIKNNYM